jgi:protein AroM
VTTGVAIGAISIGQSPRPDLVDPLRVRLPGGGVSIVELGALDGLLRSDIPPPAADGYPLTTRLRDGTVVTVEEAFLEPLVQAAVDAAEGQGCTASILLCAGRFANVTARRPFVRPFELGVATLRSLGMARLVVVVPTDEQVGPSARKWSTAGFVPVVRAAQLGEAPAAIANDLRSGVDAVVLDWVGHPAKSVRRLRALVDVPVVDLGDLAIEALPSAM